MKITNAIFAAAAALGLITACEKASYINIADDSNVSISSQAQIVEVHIMTDAKTLEIGYKYEGGQKNWIKAFYYDGTLSVTVDDNPFPETRRGVVILSSSGSSPVAFSVTQDGDPAAKDPFLVEDPEKHFLFKWNDDWQARNFIYNAPQNEGKTKDWEAQRKRFKDKMKYEPLNWNENDLTNGRGNEYTHYEVDGNYQIGLKLSQDVLDIMGGHELTRLEVLVNDQTTSKVHFVVASVVPSKASPEMPYWMRGISYDIDEVIFEGDNDHVNQNGWAQIYLSGDSWFNAEEGREYFKKDEKVTLPANGEIMVFAEIYTSAGMSLPIVHQPVSPYAPSYFTFGRTDGKWLAPLSAGTSSFNFQVRYTDEEKDRAGL